MFDDASVSTLDAGNSERPNTSSADSERPKTSSADSESGTTRSESEGIVVYLRIKPSKQPSKYYEIDSGCDVGHKLHWNIPPDAVPGSEFVNNTRTKFSFKFNRILPMDISQEQVFDRVGKDVVTNALNGFNSTILAYGQTGSGKTYTMTGGAERYDDRGVIPRALSMIFREFRERHDSTWTAHVSYMEIYNEQGYDLLNPSHEAKSLQDLPRVKMMEDEFGNFHLKNLSLHRATSEEDALNLLFLGDTNRAISETAMNQASSRSHCIFTVLLEASRIGSDRVLRSKLHMVDLAGSERVHKTKSDGQTLREAQYINTSLFYLEMVIVALNERSSKGRSHIPYRNSMMTTVLRDSLGGNCKTVMIATVSAEKAQTDESISTCRFAQRVALVKNDATINEETDHLVTIERLKAEVSRLKADIAFLKGQAGEGDALTRMERAELASACDAYVASRDEKEQLRVAPLSLVRIRECFAILKDMVVAASASTDPHPRSSSGASSSGGRETACAEEVASLRDTLMERDKEIAILVNLVRQAKKEDNLVGTITSETSSLPLRQELGLQPNGRDRQALTDGDRRRSKKQLHETGQEVRCAEVAGVSCVVSDLEVRDDPQTAYLYFCERSSAKNALEANKLLLKDKYTQARALGQKVDQSRQTISYLKQTIEQLRRERAIEGLHDTQLENAPCSAEEEKNIEAIEAEKKLYKVSFEQLRGLKSEIETIQRMLEAGRARLQSDFDLWYNQVLKQPLREAAKPTALHVERKTRIGGSRERNEEEAQPKCTASLLRTGDERTDEDILAFYRAKEELKSLQASR